MPPVSDRPSADRAGAAPAPRLAVAVGENGLLGVYTDPAYVIAYADGEVCQEFNVTYLGRVTGGSLAVSDESTDVRFVDPTAFPLRESG